MPNKKNIQYLDEKMPRVWLQITANGLNWLNHFSTIGTKMKIIITNWNRDLPNRKRQGIRETTKVAISGFLEQDTKNRK